MSTSRRAVPIRTASTAMAACQRACDPRDDFRPREVSATDLSSRTFEFSVSPGRSVFDSRLVGVTTFLNFGEPGGEAQIRWPFWLFAKCVDPSGMASLSLSHLRLAFHRTDPRSQFSAGQSIGLLVETDVFDRRIRLTNRETSLRHASALTG